ncbi:MAG: hypothetical protein EOL97_08530 [Spirochaetia bacterium]|nr:hypothetical protein [Spirochaetia bacterium]
MTNKQTIDEKISELIKETIEQIQIYVNATDEQEIRLNDSLPERGIDVYTLSKNTMMFKPQGLFQSKREINYEDIPLFILLDVLEICEHYITYYLHQKHYEKTCILTWFRKYKGSLNATERNFLRLCKKIKKEHPYFIFKEQMELIIRDQIEYYL